MSKCASCDRMEAEIKRLNEKFKELNKDLGFELRDPNGTIWTEAARLQKENARMSETLFKISCYVTQEET